MMGFALSFQGHSLVFSFSGGAPLRGDPRLLSAIPIGILSYLR